MSKRSLLVVLLAATTLAACSSPPQPPTQDHPKPKAADAHKATKTPFDDMLKDRDRAKAVQQQVDAQAKAQRKAIEDQSQ